MIPGLEGGRRREPALFLRKHVAASNCRVLTSPLFDNVLL